MKILDKLSSIIKVDLSGLKNFKIHIFNNNSSKTTIIKDSKVNIIQINIGELNKTSLKELGQIINDSVNQDSSLVIENNSQKLLQDFQAVDSKTQTQKEIEYFTGKIPQKDIEILRASIYLKSVADRGEAIHNLKTDIIARFGERGKNICNLYSTGYFNSQIKPLYQEVGTSDLLKFNQVYEQIVTESPYAVFIHIGMSDKEVSQTVRKKMEISKKYGIKYLNIHGIGKENVDKITVLIKELTPELTSLPEITSGNKFIAVKIKFE